MRLLPHNIDINELSCDKAPGVGAVKTWGVRCKIKGGRNVNDYECTESTEVGGV